MRVTTGLGLAVLAALLCPQSVWAQPQASAAIREPFGPAVASFAKEDASADVRQLADWVLGSNNHQQHAFAIVDKVHAKVFVFAANGRLRGASAALLGLAVGDDSVPGIGDRPMSEITPLERTTPAGRFVASMGHNARGERILWVDYAAAISLHKVVTFNASEQRMQRLLSPSTDDKRISYGCINVLPRFFEQIVVPAFKGGSGIVYVMPETRSMASMFFPAPIPAKLASEPTVKQPPVTVGLLPTNSNAAPFVD